MTGGIADAAARLGIALADRYRIERELGHGGMATVYLAHDLKHDRKVAIKVLKPELAAVLGADRFVVEIKTTASLQHPHILPLFDSGTADGFLFYVMPFIDGETLRAKLDRETQLSVDESVKIARDVADALEYAHQHGVIHRDIKPENILLHAGRPMVADFGIALAVSAAAGGRMTETGLSLGTPHYMSPEQATAEKEITGRSDIYSLASVLYEMLTGDPPHTGASAQQIIMKIIAEPVQPVTALRKSVPANVAAAVAQALEKLPADRFASAKAFADALSNPSFRVLGSVEATQQAGSPAWKRNFYAAAAVGVALGTYAVVSTVRGRSSSTDSPSMHLRLSLPGQRITAPLSDLEENSERPSRTAFVFTPDGKSLVFSGERDGHQQLFLRPLSGETATPIPGTEGGESPFLSPNGASLGFWANGRLRRLALSGGPPIDIATVPRIAGASWSDDDRVVVGVEDVGLIVFSVTGAAPPDTIVKDAASLPQFLPGGETILFTQRRSFDTGGRRIEAVSLETRARKVVIDNAEDARTLPTGHLVFAREGKMLAAPFDAGRLQVTAAPIVVFDDVMQAQNGTNVGVLTNAMQVAISPVGQLAWLTGGISPDRIGKIEWIDRQGRSKPIAGEGAFFMVRLSPDETRAAVFVFGRPPHVAIVDLARESAQSIDAAGHPWIMWSRDGKRVVHSGRVQDFTSLVWTLADGSKPAEPIAKGRLPESAAFWSLDGAELFELRGDNQLVRVNVATGAIRVIAGLPAGIMWPALSPDAKWLAYSAGEASGKTFDVFVQPWPALDRRWKVSTAGGIEAAWTRGGRELVYRQPARGDRDTTRMMSVDIRVDPALTVGVPHALFAAPFVGSNPLRNWDVTADGSRFIVVQNTMVHAPPGDIHVMVNWFPELRRLFARAGSRP